MRYVTIGLLSLVLGAIGLSACLYVGPEHDPHFLPYKWSLRPGDSPEVMRYSTNAYRAPDAPPYWTGDAGGGSSR